MLDKVKHYNLNSKGEREMNVRIRDNGAAFLICVRAKGEYGYGLIVKACNSLGLAWEHIQWMYRVASQEFTVGEKRVPVSDWIDGMKKAGYLD